MWSAAESRSQLVIFLTWPTLVTFIARRSSRESPTSRLPHMSCLRKARTYSLRSRASSQALTSFFDHSATGLVWYRSMGTGLTSHDETLEERGEDRVEVVAMAFVFRRPSVCLCVR